MNLSNNCRLPLGVLQPYSSFKFGNEVTKGEENIRDIIYRIEDAGKEAAEESKQKFLGGGKETDAFVEGRTREQGNLVHDLFSAVKENVDDGRRGTRR